MKENATFPPVTATAFAVWRVTVPLEVQSAQIPLASTSMSPAAPFAGERRNRESELKMLVLDMVTDARAAAFQLAWVKIPPQAMVLMLPILKAEWIATSPMLDSVRSVPEHVVAHLELP